MKKTACFAVPVVRFALGGMFLFSGLNGFFHFMPLEPPQGAAAQFMGGMAATGYFFPFLKGTETAVGLMLIIGRWVPLALTILAPVMLNIVAYHLFLAPKGLVMSLGLGVMQAYLAWSYRESFAGVLRPKALPFQGRLASPQNPASDKGVCGKPVFDAPQK